MPEIVFDRRTEIAEKVETATTQLSEANMPKNPNDDNDLKEAVENTIATAQYILSDQPSSENVTQFGMELGRLEELLSSPNLPKSMTVPIITLIRRQKLELAEDKKVPGNQDSVNNINELVDKLDSFNTLKQDLYSDSLKQEDAYSTVA